MAHAMMAGKWVAAKTHWVYLDIDGILAPIMDGEIDVALVSRAIGIAAAKAIEKALQTYTLVEGDSLEFRITIPLVKHGNQ